MHACMHAVAMVMINLLAITIFLASLKLPCYHQVDIAASASAVAGEIPF